MRYREKANHSILEELGTTTQSGVRSLDEPDFIRTELDALHKGLKSHLYFTMFFTCAFTLNLFNALLDLEEKTSNVHLIYSLFGFSVCLYFYHTWIKKKQRIALLKLLQERQAGKSDNEQWFSNFRNPFGSGEWWLKHLKNKPLEELRNYSQNKLLFFTIQVILLLLYTFKPYLGGSSQPFITTFFMLAVSFSFIDWRATIYYRTLTSFKSHN